MIDIGFTSVATERGERREEREREGTGGSAGATTTTTTTMEAKTQSSRKLAGLKVKFE